MSPLAMFWVYKCQLALRLYFPSLLCHVKRSSLNMSLKSNTQFLFFFLGIWNLFLINSVLIKQKYEGEAGRKGLQKFRMSLCRCSEAGNVFPNLPILLLDHHPVVCYIKHLQGIHLQKETKKKGTDNLSVKIKEYNRN